jgi:hypothetical protein
MLLAKPDASMNQGDSTRFPPCVLSAITLLPFLSTSAIVSAHQSHSLFEHNFSKRTLQAIAIHLRARQIAGSIVSKRTLDLQWQ